ncbi:MAG: hypothetical protein A3K67_00545 [Euryarchaeota archaeon RBG_16_62_10]|nr:MAG: hypothetical protein A3K67_00545 [Euryarchaeota archaeon RBG_16_62_10]
MDGGIKKWFMLQVWRIQQVAQIITIALLASTTAGILYDYLDTWHTGIFKEAITGIPILLLAIALAIWTFAIIWDLRLKLWRDQMTVLVERNPYTKEKLSSKEVLMFGIMWLPMMEKLSKDDPKLAASAEVIRSWVRKTADEDPETMKHVQELFAHIGKDGMALLELGKK